MAVIALAVSTLLIWQEQGRTEAQRRQAEDAAEGERRMAVEARQHQQSAEELLSHSQLDRGSRLLEEGNCLGLFDLLQTYITAERIPKAMEAVPPLWAGWQQQCAARLVHVVGHKGPVVAIAFSPDGEWLATASEDSTARVWSSASGLPVSPPLRHRAGVLAVAFSPNGKLLATGSRDGNAQLWNPATGERHGPMRHYGHDPVNSVIFSPDGNLLLLAAAGLTQVTEIQE